jgi:hypothetical protein
MDLMGGLSSILSIVAFAIFAAGIMKVFQIATTLSEIKNLLAATRPNIPIHPGVGTPIGALALHPSVQSGEEMLRAALSDLDQPVNPTSIELGNKS